MNNQHSFFYRPFFIAPGANIFAQRAERFDELAQEDKSDWSIYLSLLAHLSRTQQTLMDTNTFVLPENAEKGILPRANGDYLPEELHSVVQAIVDEMKIRLPEKRRASLERLLALSPTDFAALSQRILSQNAHPDDQFAHIWLFAAVQVIWTSWAKTLTDEVVLTRDHRETCPCCGHEAVASMVLNGGDLHLLRYQHCPVCNSRWNMLRAKCTFCGDQSAISHEKIDVEEPSVFKGARAECCGQCGHYRKLFLQTEQVNADPIADDLASLALDILVGEKGITRGGKNPFWME